MNKRSILKTIGKGILFLLALFFLGFLILLIYLTLTEFRPPALTTSVIESDPQLTPSLDDSYRAVSFNIGYAGLGEESDFFMDGGQMVLAPSQQIVEKNLAGIAETLTDIGADFTLLQEVDLDSKRSYYMNQQVYLEEEVLGQPSYYAANYKTNYVPYPWPPMGRVDAGLLTASPYTITEASRLSLTVPFSWPVRLANLKRCLLVTRTPLENSDKELVVINFHLEAYDDTGGRQQQTKELVAYMQKEYEKGNYVLAGGDFNQSLFDKEELAFNSSEEYWQPAKLDQENLGENIILAKDPAGPATSRSLHAPYQEALGDQVFYVIDGFLLTPNIQVQKVETYPQDFKYSDHNPVVLDFSLQAEAKN